MNDNIEQNKVNITRLLNDVTETSLAPCIEIITNVSAIVNEILLVHGYPPELRKLLDDELMKANQHIAFYGLPPVGIKDPKFFEDLK